MNKVVLFFLCILPLLLYGQDSLRSYTTQKVSENPPRIDGLESDEAWNLVPWSGGNFTQIEPDNGAKPSEQTYFKILYDDRNLYVLVRAEDSDPQKIVKRMSRRDGFDGDWVEINIDSYYDKRTAFSFTSSVSGVKGDEYVSNNGDNWDGSWDPIWDLETSIDDKGWIAEFRIPLSQLRFGFKDEQVWGIQLTRRFFRNNERSTWQFIPKDASGWVHLFGELRGIKGIKPQKQLEIQPYIVTQTERFEKEAGNPYATGKSSHIEAGVDAKIGITSDITLDLTVNPDFGQVEADPSQVNLSAFQLFFQERRPFFIEGNNILNFPVTGWNNNNLFYSRRIGRQPQREVETDDDAEDDVDEYVKSASNSRILGAAKLTGKNKNGFSFGVLESVTGVEKATIDSLGHQRTEKIEPMTNYFVARVQQDFKQGETILGGMFTATNRNLDDPAFNELHTDAYSGGLDFNHFWKDRSYFVRARVLMSQVAGSREAIAKTQRSSERFFQRSDNDYKKLDTTRTSLTGTGGVFVIGKRQGQLTYEAGYTWTSPELELNDIGFLSQTDLMTEWAVLAYKTINPVGIFRSLRVETVQWADLDFGWNVLSKGVETTFNSEFKNMWTFNVGMSYQGENKSNADLRGGPSITYPGGMNSWIYVGTDPRKKLRFGVNPSLNLGNDGFRRNSGLWTEIEYRPMNALALSLNPSISQNKDELQYVTTTDNDEYIVGQIDQMTYDMSLRITYMITPNLSLQYWGQPFASSGAYTDFKRITAPSAESYNDRFTKLNSSIGFNSEDDEYTIDENRDGVTDYSFENPDFNFTQFRSNMVLRWEYIPGSTFFLVWTQNRTEEPSNNEHSFNHLYDGLMDKQPHNIFLMKFTYRFVL